MLQGHSGSFDTRITFAVRWMAEREAPRRQRMWIDFTIGDEAVEAKIVAAANTGVHQYACCSPAVWSRISSLEVQPLGAESAADGWRNEEDDVERRQAVMECEEWWVVIIH